MMLPDDLGFPVAYNVATSTSCKIGTVTLSYSYESRFSDAPKQYQWTIDRIRRFAELGRLAKERRVEKRRTR